jgi:hypothetical protein
MKPTGTEKKRQNKGEKKGGKEGHVKNRRKKGGNAIKI